MPEASPDQDLMRPGERLDRFGVGAVAGDGAVVMPIGAYQIGQQFGIPRIGGGNSGAGFLREE
jgi:hypothetical protein